MTASAKPRSSRPSAHGIRIKKEHGQHFLRDEAVVDHMLAAVTLTESTSVLEVGPGDGFLTRAILQTPITRLWTFEIDPEWVAYINTTVTDPRLHIFEQDFLRVDAAVLAPHAPWTVLANLPYHITFPILHAFVAYRQLLAEGVIMMQEEVAQKITKTSGRDYGFVSLYFQHYFIWRMLDKIPPSAFVPPPKVFSRLLYFKPRTDMPTIPDEPAFWQFIKRAFKQPRRTLRNNLEQGHYDISRIPADILSLRAQQMTMSDLLALWQVIRIQ